MSTRYIPKETASVIENIQSLVNRGASPREIVECLFKFAQSTEHWVISDLYYRYRSFWSLLAENDLLELDPKHQAMFASISILDSEWEQHYRTILDSGSFSIKTKSIFAAKMISLQNSLGRPLLFVEKYCQLYPLAQRSFPCSFNQDTICFPDIDSYASTLPSCLLKSIEEDNVAQFEIFKTVCGETFTSDFAKILLKHNAVKILIHHLGEVERFIAPKDILFFCASSLPVTALTIIDTLNAQDQNLIRTARDIFGNNALWYRLHRTAEKQCIPTVEHRLVELGCRTDEPNCYGLTYHSMLAARKILSSL